MSLSNKPTKQLPPSPPHLNYTHFTQKSLSNIKNKGSKPLGASKEKLSPKISSTIPNSKTFYSKNESLNTHSQRNNHSFLGRDQRALGEKIGKIGKKKKKGVKTKHTKGNNSVYIKDFEKLMKERSYMDNKSAKRMTVVKQDNFNLMAKNINNSEVKMSIYLIKPEDAVDYNSKMKVYAAPTVKKGTKKNKKTLNNILDKQMYHKRVKSDQIYNVKLLNKPDDKINKKNLSKFKNSQNFQKEGPKTRISKRGNQSSIPPGFSQFAFKKGIDLQQSLIQSKKKNSYKSHNCTPKKLNSSHRIPNASNCLAQSKKGNSRPIKTTQKGKLNPTKIGYQNFIAEKSKSNINNCSELSHIRALDKPDKKGSNFIQNQPTVNAKMAPDFNPMSKLKNLSSRGSNIMSPQQKISQVENNRKNLRDYHKDKRTQNFNSGIVFNNKPNPIGDGTKDGIKDIRDRRKKSQGSKQTTQELHSSRMKKKSSKTSKFGEFSNKTPSTVKNSSSMHYKKFPKRDGLSDMEKSLQKEERIKELRKIKNQKVKESLESYKPPPQVEEEEKKLPLSDEKVSSKAKTINIEDDSKPKSTTEVISQFYRVGKVLGKGAFGKVNLAIDRKTKNLVAMKSINKHFIADTSSKSKLAQEVSILKIIDHRNIVCMKDHIETENHVIFVMELCAGGDLLNYVRKRRKLTENTAKVLFMQILAGLEYCHNNNILHRDIKLDNILLDSRGEVKIGDFGVSKIVKDGEVMLDQCGTPAYIAPEILLDDGYTGYSIDIWSAGVVLYAMLYGTVPFKAHNMKELHKSIIMAKYSLKETISDSAMDLIKKILEPNPYKRLNISEIRKHEWFSEIDSDIEIFNEQEKEKIIKEFTYNNTDKYNRNPDNLALSREDNNSCTTIESFTEHNLSTQNSLVRNHSTKSVILAPFNSTISSIDQETKDFIRKFMGDRKALKFHARCRDVNRQYEQNNNCELDNGVYNKFMLDDK